MPFAALALGFIGLDRLAGGGGFDQVLLLALRTPGDLADPIGSAQVEKRCATSPLSAVSPC